LQHHGVGDELVVADGLLALGMIIVPPDPLATKKQPLIVKQDWCTFPSDVVLSLRQRST